MPPGTYRPTRLRGMIRWPITRPSSSLTMKLLRTWCLWKASILFRACFKISMKASSQAAKASAISSSLTRTVFNSALSNLAAYSFKAASPFARTLAMISSTMASISLPAWMGGVLKSSGLNWFTGMIFIIAAAPPAIFP